MQAAAELRSTGFEILGNGTCAMLPRRRPRVFGHEVIIAQTATIGLVVETGRRFGLPAIAVLRILRRRDPSHRDEVSPLPTTQAVRHASAASPAPLDDGWLGLCQAEPVP
jgi:hypothetical protein